MLQFFYVFDINSTFIYAKKILLQFIKSYFLFVHITMNTHSYIF